MQVSAAKALGHLHDFGQGLFVLLGEQTRALERGAVAHAKVTEEVEAELVVAAGRHGRAGLGNGVGIVAPLGVERGPQAGGVGWLAKGFKQSDGFGGLCLVAAGDDRQARKLLGFERGELSGGSQRFPLGEHGRLAGAAANVDPSAVHRRVVGAQAVGHHDLTVAALENIVGHTAHAFGGQVACAKTDAQVNRESAKNEDRGHDDGQPEQKAPAHALKPWEVAARTAEFRPPAPGQGTRAPGK